MADQLESIVQRMIDAGEPEENIASVIKAQSAEPFNINKSRAILTLANQRPLPKRDVLADFATSGPMGDINEAMGAAGQGNYARAAHKAIKGIGTILAPAALPAAVAAPAAAIGGLMLGAGGGLAGRGVASLATDNPDVIDLAGDVGGLAGGAAGAKLGASSAPLIGKGLQLVGQAAEKTPTVVGLAGKGAKALGVRLQGPPPVSPVVPVADASASLPTAAVPGRAAYAPLAGHAEPSPVVATADAAAARPSAVRVGREPYAPLAGQPEADAVRSLVVSNADAAASAPGARMADLGREPYTVPAVEGVGRQTPKETTGEIMRDQRNLARVEKYVAQKNASAESAAAAEAAIVPKTPPSPQEVADAYAKEFGFKRPGPHTPVRVDPEFGKQVAAAYEKIQDNPNDPETKRAYAALADEIGRQFKFITEKTGLKVEPWAGEGQPYAKSADMMADVKNNNHMWYFPTEAGFGQEAANAANPLLAKSQSGLRVNDELRIVHDYFAHAKGGHQFGPHGEENAFLEHLKLLSPDAAAALATETRGQNSYVNFGPHAHLPPTERPFAQQKTGLLPPELRNARPAPSTTKGAIQSALDALPNKRSVSNMEVVDTAGGPNASGESAASAEALSRLSSMKAKGESFAVLKGGKLRTLIGPEAVDYVPQPGEQFGIVDKDMAFRMLSRGSTKLTPDEAALIGNRSKGALPLAERKALLDAMLKKGGQ